PLSLLVALCLLPLRATAPTALYTLSLHDALPILALADRLGVAGEFAQRSAEPPGQCRADQQTQADQAGAEPGQAGLRALDIGLQDRKSTRLNSSHVKISYAVFCLKKKKKQSHHNE